LQIFNNFNCCHNNRNFHTIGNLHCYSICLLLLEKKKNARYNKAHIVQANIVQNSYIPARDPNQQQPQNNNQPQNNYQQQQQPQFNNQKSVPIHNVILPNGEPYFPNEPNKQEDYAIHESQMGQLNHNVKIVGQPLQDNINYGYNYPQNNNL